MRKEQLLYMGENSNNLDYRKIAVNQKMVSLYKKAYKCFGWILICSDNDIKGHASGTTETLEFMRDRKIMNKAELTRLQRNFDACANEICEMEESKTDTASKVSCGVSIMGSIFICCSVLLSVASQLAASILLAIPGLLGWLLPSFIYKTIVKKKTEAVNPLIEQKYDEIHQVCRKAQGLTDCE